MIHLEDICHGKEVSLAASSDYLWATHDGECLRVGDMTTTHLFYSVRMLYNHSVPEDYRLPDCKYWRLGMPMAERRVALKHLLAELSTRTVDFWMIQQLETMRFNLRVLAAALEGGGE